MKWKEIIEEYLVVSKKERWGIYILSLITLMVWLVPYCFSREENIEEIFDLTYLQIDTAKQLLIEREARTYPQQKENYPYNNGITKGNENYPKQVRNKIISIDINQADSAAFEHLPAIGEKLSSRIVRYRERLGGFITVQQLKEVYGLSDSAFHFILPHLTIAANFQPKRILINKVGYTELRKHPYVTHEFIKIVLAYRKQHGNFKDLKDVEKIIQLDAAVLSKVAPYLSFLD